MREEIRGGEVAQRETSTFLQVTEREDNQCSMPAVFK